MAGISLLVGCFSLAPCKNWLGVLSRFGGQKSCEILGLGVIDLSADFCVRKLLLVLLKLLDVEFC